MLALGWHLNLYTGKWPTSDFLQLFLRKSVLLLLLQGVAGDGVEVGDVEL